MAFPKANDEATLLRLSNVEKLRALGSELKSGPPAYHDHADHLWGAAERIERDVEQLKADFEIAYGPGQYQKMTDEVRGRAARIRQAEADAKAEEEAELLAAEAARTAKSQADTLKEQIAEKQKQLASLEGLRLDTEQGPKEVVASPNAPRDLGSPVPPTDPAPDA